APGTYEWRIIETTLALTIETALALLDRIEALEQERDAARAEAERWRKKYEVLRAGVERVADDLHMAADEAHDNWRITADFNEQGRSIGLEEAEQMVRRRLTEAGVATSEPPRHHWADAECEDGGAARLGVDGQGEPQQNPGVNAQTGGSSDRQTADESYRGSRRGDSRRVGRGHHPSCEGRKAGFCHHH